MLGAIALGTALGLALAPWIAGAPWPLLALPLLTRLQAWPRTARVLAVLLAIGPAAWWGTFRAPAPAPNDVSDSAPRRFYKLTGTIATPPEPSDDGWRAEVEVEEGRGRLRVSWTAHSRPNVGDRWAWAGRLSRPHGPDNPRRARRGQAVGRSAHLRHPHSGARRASGRGPTLSVLGGDRRLAPRARRRAGAWALA